VDRIQPLALSRIFVDAIDVHHVGNGSFGDGQHLAMPVDDLTKCEERGEKCHISTSRKMTFFTWVKDREDE
jgi:hypothetical protein